jgi:Ca2+-binding RTX toxin-like protein
MPSKNYLTKVLTFGLALVALVLASAAMAASDTDTHAIPVSETDCVRASNDGEHNNLHEGDVEGTEDDDAIHAGVGNDHVNAHQGNDVVIAGTGDDDVHGGIGDDTICGGGGRDHLDGEQGDDELAGDTGNDTLTGHAGNDVEHGGVGNDTILGGTGHDHLTGGAGHDTIIAGAGNDTVHVKDGKVDQVDCGLGSDHVTADRSDVLKGCEIVKH